MGLGKTIQVISLILKLKEENKAENAIKKGVNKLNPMLSDIILSFFTSYYIFCIYNISIKR